MNKNLKKRMKIDIDERLNELNRLIEVMRDDKTSVDIKE